MSREKITARANFCIKKGDDWTQRVYFTDDNGEPEDIDGWTFKMDIRPGYGETAIATLQLASGITVIGPTTDGVIELALTATQTGAVTIPDSDKRIPALEAIYDFQSTDADGKKTTEFEGDFIFEKKVTS